MLHSVHATGFPLNEVSAHKTFYDFWSFPQEKGSPNYQTIWDNSG